MKERKMAEHDMDRDRRRYERVIRGEVRKNLSKYVKREDIVRKYIDEQGNEREKIVVPIPRIEQPRFKFDDRHQGGVGQGDGDVGDSLSGKDGDGGDIGQAGDKPGEYEIEVELTMEKFVDLLADELELPDLKKDGKKYVVGVEYTYNDISRHGSRGLRHLKRTLRENLKRQMGSGTYDPKNPILVPEKPDFRYKAPRPKIIEGMQALIIYIMDYSGSMGIEQKEMARHLSFWINRWIKRNYKGVEVRFIVHDTTAREVSEEDFFRISSNGGTIISSSYRLMLEIIEKEYNLNEWNIYAFQFSDGENFDQDNPGCKTLVKERILPTVNMFGYTQVGISGASSRLMDIIKDAAMVSKFPERLRRTMMTSNDDVLQAMKELLGKKR